jgi:aminoglycoside 2''-phosphotransferase
MAEKEVKYVEYIKSRFPQLDISNIKFNLSDGKYNDIVIINEESAFKFSRYDWTVAFLENEAKATNLINPYVGIPVPQVEYLDKGVAKYEFMKGTPLFRNEILLWKDNDQNYMAKQIGTFLKQLHAIPLKKAKASGIGEVTTNLSREAFLSEYENIKRKVYPYFDSYVKESVEQIFEPMLENKDFLKFNPAVIHANLTPTHFICDKDLRKINAVIGFGSAGIGDPAYDISILIDSLGETFVKRVGRYYGDMTSLLDRARFYAYFNHLIWAERLADRITTRDFSDFKFQIQASDIMPFGRSQ